MTVSSDREFTQAAFLTVLKKPPPPGPALAAEETD
jgi:hypothetical protein